MSIIISIVPIVIGTSPTATAAAKAANTKETDVVEFPSNIRNEKLLRETLVKMGAKNIQKSLGSDIDHFHITFVQQSDQTFNIRFVGNVRREEAINFKNDLIAEYSNLVQNYVYETLKRKAEEKGLRLEKEILQSDQTIVLTYNIN
ncbi:MAG: hypothetical protein FWF53_06620 [Candidatus Azobacteroides sp.]|nr:hypothetical protein [Candidatus Azobacteroides sp.]